MTTPDASQKAQLAALEPSTSTSPPSDLQPPPPAYDQFAQDHPYDYNGSTPVLAFPDEKSKPFGDEKVQLFTTPMVNGASTVVVMPVQLSSSGAAGVPTVGGQQEMVKGYTTVSPQVGTQESQSPIRDGSFKVLTPNGGRAADVQIVDQTNNHLLLKSEKGAPNKRKTMMMWIIAAVLAVVLIVVISVTVVMLQRNNQGSNGGSSNSVSGAGARGGASATSLGSGGTATVTGTASGDATTATTATATPAPGITPGPLPIPSATYPPGIFQIIANAGLCLSASRYNSSEISLVVLEPCAVFSDSETFRTHPQAFFTDGGGLVRSLRAEAKCLNKNGAVSRVGDPLTFFPCNPQDPNSITTYDPTTRHLQAQISGYCYEQRDSFITARKCIPGSVQQQYLLQPPQPTIPTLDLPELNSRYFTLRNEASGQCLAYTRQSAPETGASVPLRFEPCTSTTSIESNQAWRRDWESGRWMIADQFFQCINLFGNNDVLGAAVMTRRCHNPVQNNELFSLDASGFMRTRVNGLCIEQRGDTAVQMNSSKNNTNPHALQQQSPSSDSTIMTSTANGKDEQVPVDDKFTKLEIWNIAFYIGGIMAYKFALETMNTCMNGVLLNRLNSGDTKTLWTTAQAINVIGQCIGSLLVAPLVRRMYAGRLLSTSILLFGLVIVFIPILEGATGGKINYTTTNGSKIKENWGNWSPYLVFLFYTIAGVFWGMVELMRRVIPAEIVGENPVKLRRMDSIVHILYEITGTTGALFAPYWISYFGWGYALAIMPIGFTISAICWTRLKPSADKIKLINDFQQERAKRPVGIAHEVKHIFLSFFHSVSVGAKLVFTQRALVWLIPAYALALVHHRYLENTLFPFYAKGEIGNSDYQSILTGGSNFGELLGAVTVLLLARQVKTPIPFLRLDSIFCLVIWVLPYISVDKSDPRGFAWKLAPIMSLISFGWAAGDISLAAYVQSRLAKLEGIDKRTSPLGAVMSFLYVTYLVTFTALNIGVGRVADAWPKDRSKELYIYIGGVFMTLAGAIVFASTFIPRGAFAFNPDPDHVVFDEEVDVGKGNGESTTNIVDLDTKKGVNDDQLIGMVVG
ncbi:hypothetical protein HDV05_000684 [Chytridiales sp. JEL 0842]|nr:hypothetical protein HDV05_000684 [Chytridiales sp. JEL 0842]